MSLRSRIRGGQDYLTDRVATAAQFLTLRLIPIGSTHMGCYDSDGPGHAPRYLYVSPLSMNDIRDCMIEKIQQAGMYATKRDWAMGETIVAARALKDDGDGLKYFDGYICVYPIESLRWGLDIGGINAEEYSDDNCTVNRVIELLRMPPEELNALVVKYKKAYYKDQG